MASACIFCSGRSESAFVRVADFIYNWWSGYTVLYNRGLVEEALRRKRRMAGGTQAQPASDTSHL